MQAEDTFNWSTSKPILKQQVEARVVVETVEHSARVDLQTEVGDKVHVSTMFSASEGTDLYYAIVGLENRADEFDSIEELREYLAESF